MVDVQGITNSLHHILVRVPPVEPGVCAVCHGAPNPGFDVCRSCSQARSQVSRPTRLIVPMSLCEAGGQLHHLLRDYKDDPDPDNRRFLSSWVAALLARFLETHEVCIRRASGRRWSAIAVVPSSRGRPGRHPLEAALTSVGVTGEILRPLQPGPVRVDHNRASDHGYEVRMDVVGTAFLLVDDTLTSSARLQSAASALQLAGADVVAAVTVGRYLNPERSQTDLQLLARARAAPFRFDECCLERPDPLWA